MHDIHVLIKNAIQKRGLTRAEVAAKAGVSVDTITNIVYGKTRKRVYIEKVAAALDINLDKLYSAFYESVCDGPKLDLQRHHRILSLLDKVLMSYDMQVSKKLFDLMAGAAYDFATKQDCTDQELVTYVQGMVDLGMLLIK